ncbi:pectate lyase-domain-containing protein [Zopfochytrium polystomum]|nr:pectate lyase-domain-containing protein [Zopfochytrium polystomum]
MLLRVLALLALFAAPAVLAEAAPADTDGFIDGRLEMYARGTPTVPLYRRAAECQEECLKKCDAKTGDAKTSCIANCNTKRPCPAAPGSPAPTPTTCVSSTNGPPVGLPAIFPKATGGRSCSASVKIYENTIFDGGMLRYDRGKGYRPANNCLTVEADTKDTIFILENNATLQNVLIGEEVFDSVHCLGSCTLKNVWFERTCEDSWSLKDDTTCKDCKMTWTKGAIWGFKDKGVQHNGGGTVYLTDIDAFYTEQMKGKLYRSCGGCGYPDRHVVMDNVRIHGIGGEAIAGVNSEKGDTAIFNNVQVANTLNLTFICEQFPAHTDGKAGTSSCIFQTPLKWVAN